MLENGQPMHVFDQDKIEGDIEAICKNKRTNKNFREKNLKLTNDCLVIADEKEPIAFAGISGGLNHSVSRKQYFFDRICFSSQYY